METADLGSTTPSIPATGTSTSDATTSRVTGSDSLGPDGTNSDLGRLAQCVACGVERDGHHLPQQCPICADERQYVPQAGQQWVWPLRGARPGAHLTFEEVEPGVELITQYDVVGIGQAPLLVHTEHGNVLVEVPAHFDELAVRQVRERGGLQAIIASHPHMYGLQSLWSGAFDDCPVYVSRADQQWLGVRPANLVVWEGSVAVLPGVVATQPGGHFPGSAVVHWAGRDGNGVLFTGDTITPTMAAGWVTFMRSYPNQIPLSAAVVERIAEHVAQHDFDRLYGNFGRRVERDARGAVLRSARRYAAWVSGANDHLT